MSRLYGDWGVALRITNTMATRVKRAAREAMIEEAHFLRKEIVQGITSGAPAGQAFKPLSPATLAVRRFRGFGGSKPLLNRADLRNSIIVKTVGDGVFIGILRNARGKGGGAIANIADIHEFGSRPIVIHMTPKMRRFLMAAFRAAGVAIGGHGGGGGTGIIIVQIPARPFMRPIFEKYSSNKEEVAKRFLGRVAKRLNGDLGFV